jgi:hypothetical protein
MPEEKNTEWSRGDIINIGGLFITLIIVLTGAISIVTMLQADATHTKKAVDRIELLMHEYETKKEAKLEKLTEKLSALEIEITALRARENKR